MIIDDTFNTNTLRLPLLISVGITNSGKTFPTGFSYCPSESTESYQFFFQSMKETAFIGEIQLPRVIVGFWWSWPDAAFLILVLSGNLALLSLGLSAHRTGSAN